jgi:hypothetical protein
MAYLAINEPFPALDGEVSGRRQREHQAGSLVFLKNNTTPKPAWQEIVDFS